VFRSVGHSDQASSLDHLEADDYRRDPPTARPDLAPPTSEIALTVVIPAYNEQERLPALLDSLGAHIDADRTEVFVVDDGSTDGTAELANELLRQFRHGHLIQHAINRGKGGAVRSGVLRASGRSVIYMDADAATELSSIEVLLQGLAVADVAVGSRAHDDSVVAGSKRSRIMMGRTFNRLTRALTGLTIRDTQCGFKAFRAHAARMLFVSCTTNGFAFDVEVLTNAHRLGFTVTEVPVTWRHVEGSKVSGLLDPLRMSADLIRATYRPTVFDIGGVRLMDPFALHLSAAALPHHAVVIWGSQSVEVLLAGDSDEQLHAVATTFRGMGIDAEPFTRTVDVRRSTPARTAPSWRQVSPNN
jgi:dolichyl-phosphate beta-glucosyltransferase